MSEPILSASSRKSIAAAIGECRRCEPLIDLLKESGVDVTERERRLQHIKQMAETVLQLTEPGAKYGQSVR